MMTKNYAVLIDGAYVRATLETKGSSIGLSGPMLLETRRAGSLTELKRALRADHPNIPLYCYRVVEVTGWKEKILLIEEENL